MPITFVHTADIHFGMENYGRIDPKTGIHSRLLDFEKAINFCVDYAIAKDVDLFVFAGDAYKTANPTPTHQRLLMKAFLKLYNAKIPIVMAVGNHDNPLSFGKANALEIFGQIPLDGFYVFSKPETLVIQTKNGPVQIVGIPWPTRNFISLQSSNASLTAQELTQNISIGVSNIIKSLASKLNPEWPAILVGHLTVSSGIFSGSEKRAVYGTDPIFMPSELAIKPFDYIALGHLHRFQNLNPNGIPIIYSGSPERIDFGERKEEKGFCLVTLKSKYNLDIEFIKTPVRKFIQIEVILNEDSNFTKQILSEIFKHDINDAIIKILYFLPISKKERVDLNAIQQACINCWYLVGIIPIKAHEEKERRTHIAIDMNLENLLAIYLNNKPEYKLKKESIIKKALELQAELTCDK